MSLKVAVIGGGPAGLSAAIEGAKLGLKIKLFERYKIGEKIACAEGFFDLMSISPRPTEGIRYSIEKIIFKFENNNYILPASHLKLWMIDRQKWQKALAEKAISLGVDIEEKARVLPEDMSYLKKEYDYIVDACGISSPTASLFGFTKRLKESAGRGFQYTLEGDFSHLQSNILIGAMGDYIGYYWIFPTESHGKQNRANVGAGFFPTNGKDGPNVKEELKKVIRKEGLEGYKVIKSCGGLIPVKFLDNLVWENILLAGDAAGLASPLHGGGIDTAVYSGILASRCIYKNNLHNYRRILQEGIGCRLKAEKELTFLWQEIGMEGLNSIFSMVFSKNKRTVLPNIIKFKKAIITHRHGLIFFLKTILKDSNSVTLFSEILER